MQPLEEKDSSPLEDTEITRLIKVSRELGYKKQDKIPERNLVDFKPISITQIATSSDNKINEPIDGSERTDPAEIAENEIVIENTEAPDNKMSANEPNLEPLNTESSVQATSEHKEISEPLDDTLTNGTETLESPTQSKKILTEETFEDKGPEVGSAEDRLAEQTAVEETPVLSAQDATDSMEQAKQTDIEIGKKAAIADFQNKQKEALESFHTILDNIKKKEAVDKTALTESILRAVTRLASERAGTIIDDHPETFKNKIISFADKIEQLSTNLILNLNPVDADLLKKTLSKSLSDKKSRNKKEL
jgi:flagellar biosynthesis/type III secretory pathway protein FliH